jgi:chemotaxis protein CheD
MLEVECALPEIYLQPGEVHVALEPSIIGTLLGSCVGVTFWSPRSGVGALCHALLPKCPKKASSRLSLAAGRRYVDFVIRDLARQFDKLGVPREEIQVKLFGGADVLPVNTARPSRPTVGSQNCAVALEVVRAEGFQVLASSLGGTLGRSIKFYTASGEVRLRWLSHAGSEDVAER